MARTIEQVQADIDAVLAQAANAETLVRGADGRETQNRGEEQRQKALQGLRAELALLQTSANPSGKTRTFFLYGKPGF